MRAAQFFFMPCVCYGKQAAVAATLERFAKVEVSGRLCWTGGDCKSFFIHCDTIELTEKLLPSPQYDASVFGLPELALMKLENVAASRDVSAATGAQGG